MKAGKLEKIDTKRKIQDLKIYIARKLVRKKINSKLEISYIAKSSNCYEFYADFMYAWSLV